MLSNPSPTSSEGKSRARFKSRPVKSRIVLSYSARFRRRSVTRPGSRIWSQSTVNTPLIQVTSNSRSASLGCNAPSGGIAPNWSISEILPQVSRCLRIDSGESYMPTLISASW
jgi:hypothetical protein